MFIPACMYNVPHIRTFWFQRPRTGGDCMSGDISINYEKKKKKRQDWKKEHFGLP